MSARARERARRKERERNSERERERERDGAIASEVEGVGGGKKERQERTWTRRGKCRDPPDAMRRATGAKARCHDNRLLMNRLTVYQ
jgi:hypothetical protein